MIVKYKNIVHTTTGMKLKDGPENDKQLLLKTTYSFLETIDGINNQPPKFQLNNFLRISKFKEILSKACTSYWSNKIFKILKIIKANPRNYKLKDYGGNQIKSDFYTERLQLVKHHDNFLIEKILLFYYYYLKKYVGKR